MRVANLATQTADGVSAFVVFHVGASCGSLRRESNNQREELRYERDEVYAGAVGHQR